MVAQCRGYDMIAVTVVWRDGIIDAAACWRQRTPLSNRYGSILAPPLQLVCWRQRMHVVKNQIGLKKRCLNFQFCEHCSTAGTQEGYIQNSFSEFYILMWHTTTFFETRD
jgi:hypothetical protein